MLSRENHVLKSWNEIKDKFYNDITTDGHYYSVTFTLNPKSGLYKSDILHQYNTMIGEIASSMLFWEQNYAKLKSLQKERNVLSEDFEEMFIIPELTDKFVVHFHGYFKIKDPERAMIVRNEFYKFTSNSPIIGKQAEFKLYDDLNKKLGYTPLEWEDQRDTVQGYPFKDIQKVLMKFPDSKFMKMVHFFKTI